MWFDRKQRREHVAEETPDLEHWPTERMIAEGHADYATPEDLEGLDDAILTDIAQLCEVDQFAPDECIPCLAHVTLLERRSHDEAEDEPEHPFAFVDEYFGPSTPKLEPPAQRFAAKVRELDALVAELLEGPPIPPPNVSLEELAALVVGAEKWVKMIDAQGLELAPAQKQVKDEIERVIAKTRRNQ